MTTHREMTEDVYRVMAWAQDFCKALFERNRLSKLIFRAVVGKYAYREFLGLLNMLEKSGFSALSDYELESMVYHDGDSEEWPYPKKIEARWFEGVPWYLSGGGVEHGN